MNLDKETWGSDYIQVIKYGYGFNLQALDRIGVEAFNR